MANSFAFSCPNCNHQMKLPASAEGKKGKCPKCSEVVHIIPDAPEPPAVTQQIPSPQQQSIPEPVLPEEAVVPSSPPETGSPKASSGKKKLFIGIGIVVLAVVAVVLFFVLRGSNEVVEDVEAKKQRPVNKYHHLLLPSHLLASSGQGVARTGLTRKNQEGKSQ